MKILNTILKKSLWLIAGLVIWAGLSVNGQVGNEWINYDQSYLKVKTAQDGIYRLTYQQLMAAGFPVNSIDPRKIQLFHRGVEQAIEITGQADGTFNTGDLLYFYGKKNDGTLDAELYRPREAQPHQYHNIYSDTTAYFLTYRLDAGQGKRMVRETAGGNISAMSPQAITKGEAFRLEVGAFYAGLSYTQGSVTNIFMSWFDYGGAFMGTQIRRGQSRDHTISNLTTLNTSGPNPTMELMLIGRNRGPHRSQILVGPTTANLRSVGFLEFEDHNAIKGNFELNWSDIGPNGQMVVRVSSVGVAGVANDFHCPAYFLIEYPKTFDGAGSEKIITTPQATGNSKIALPNSAGLFEVFDVTDTNNIRILRKAISGANTEVAVLQAGTEKTLWKAATADIKTPVLERVTFSRFNPADYNYYLVSHYLLMQAGGRYANPVAAYRDYRASPQGGSFDALTVEINDIYNQFSYGEVTATGLLRFTKYIYDSGREPFMFLIGKPVNPRLSPYRNANPNENNRDFVPTAGEPLSDNLFSLGLGGNPLLPYVPTGRLNARNAEQVANYLDKVIEHEARPFDDLDRKKMLHLSGGANTVELNAFRSFLNSFKTIAEGPLMGADVTTVGKRTTSTVELINISQEVNEGVALITFFGHSGADVADIDIGFASIDGFGYRNKGKYPILLVNGCDAGNYSTTAKTFGEDWITTKDRGAIGFIAHSHVGITSQLRRFTEIFYRTALTDSVYINESIGKVFYEAFRIQIDGRGSNLGDIAHLQQTNFQGDPGIRLFSVPKADYAVASEELYVEAFDGRNVRIELDSFRLAIPIKNFGLATLTPLEVDVSRTLPDGRVINQSRSVFNNIFNSDTVFISIVREELEPAGINSIQVRLDPDNKLDELRKDNNIASFQFNISISGTANIFPGNFSIQNKTNLELITLANDLLEGEREFLMELDTTRFFTSPATRRISQIGDGISKWRVDLSNLLPAQDTTVIYWRSKYAQAMANEDTAWTISSFTYINNGPKGWAQAHQMQFEENLTAGLESNYPQGRWEFQSSRNQLLVRTYGNNHPNFNNTNIDVLLNDFQFIINASYGACRNNTLNAIAFDQFSSIPYRVLSYNQFDVLDPASCGRVPQVINNMTQADITGGRRMLENYVNGVKEGDVVVIYSAGLVQYQSWTEATYQAFAEIGLDPASIKALQNGEPMIVFGVKGGEIGTATFVKAEAGSNASEQEIIIEQTITGRFGLGRFKTGNIGPAISYGAFTRNIQRNSAAEQSKFNIYGITPTQGEDLLFSNVQSSNLNLSNVPANIYPYLRLELILENEETFSPAQLKNWIVSYNELAEGVLYSLQPSSENSVVQGAVFRSQFEFFNISSGVFSDSLLVQYEITNRQTSLKKTGEFLVKPPASGEGTSFELPISTIDMVGVNDLIISINDNLQPEQDYQNNKLVLNNFLIVSSDGVAPVVDVAFDGAYIMDGEIVSSRPTISIELRDDNKFLLKTDTTGMVISLKSPCASCTYQTIPFSSPKVQWFAATQTTPFRVELKPELLEDGIYSLRVQAADAAGNAAGFEPYSISFEVSNASEITNFYPYPNPFSTSTRFVFTLTGSEIPDDIRIQVMTVSGKVVREIGMEEIGNVRIGNNLTEFAWDGTDQFGDRLANGVYFYRVLVQKAGGIMGTRASAGDKGFKNGFGKLYILR
jgi:hypothetical protein